MAMRAQGQLRGDIPLLRFGYFPIWGAMRSRGSRLSLRRKNRCRNRSRCAAGLLQLLMAAAESEAFRTVVRATPDSGSMLSDSLSWSDEAEQAQPRARTKRKRHKTVTEKEACPALS